MVGAHIRMNICIIICIFMNLSYISELECINDWCTCQKGDYDMSCFLYVNDVNFPIPLIQYIRNIK